MDKTSKKCLSEITSDEAVKMGLIPLGAPCIAVVRRTERKPWIPYLAKRIATGLRVGAIAYTRSYGPLPLSSDRDVYAVQYWSR